MNRARKQRLKRVAGFFLLFLLVLGAIVILYRLPRSLQRGRLTVLREEPRTPGLSEEERQLADHLRNLERLDEDKILSVVAELQGRMEAGPGAGVSVTIQDLNLDRAVPVNMRRGESAEGVGGVWITLRDDEQREAGFHVAESELGPEELRALRAFEIIENTPMLHHIRPLLFDRLIRTLPDK